MNKKELAELILAQVGGTGNIEDVFHCMTRLRFKLKDETVVSLEELKKISGVLGAQFAEHMLQVIIGPAVNDVYRELTAVGGLTGHEAILENPDKDLFEKAGEKKFSIKAVPGKIIAVFSNSMEPLVPLFVALGMLNIVAAIIGPTLLKLVSADSDLYNNFYQAGQAIIYFLPIYVAITASRYFKTNTYVSITLAALMLFPGITELLAGEGGYTVYGISAPDVAYNGQIIPILLVVWIQSYVEKLLNKYVSDSLKVLLVAFGTIAVMMPLEFLVLGPLGTRIGSMLVGFFLGLYQAAGPVETMLVGAISPFALALGVTRPVFFACMNVLFAEGVEYAYMPIAMALSNFVMMGAAAGYALKAPTADRKKLGLTCLVANALGGVSEPSLFGIIIPDKKTYLSVILGGAAAGLLCGLLRVGYYQFGPSNVLSVLGFVTSENGNNLLFGCICAAVAFLVSFVTMLLTYKAEKK